MDQADRTKVDAGARCLVDILLASRKARAHVAWWLGAGFGAFLTGAVTLAALEEAALAAAVGLMSAMLLLAARMAR